MPAPTPSILGKYLLCSASVCSHVLGKGSRIASLHKHGAGTREFAHQTFARAHVADDAATRHSFEDVVAVPRDQVAIVDDVFFAFPELGRVGYNTGSAMDGAGMKIF